jgi:hypothetical protein
MADVHKTNIINIFFRTLILIIIFSLHISHYSLLISHLLLELLSEHEVELAAAS